MSNARYTTSTALAIELTQRFSQAREFTLGISRTSNCYGDDTQEDRHVMKVMRNEASIHAHFCTALVLRRRTNHVCHFVNLFSPSGVMNPHLHEVQTRMPL